MEQEIHSTLQYWTRASRLSSFTSIANESPLYNKVKAMKTGNEGKLI